MTATPKISFGVAAILIFINVNELKNHSDTPGSAGILPAFGRRDARAPRVLSSFGVA